MPSAWLPGAVAEQIIAEKAGFDEAKRFVGFRKRLKAVDSRLDAFLCDRADPDNELRMGFYYVFRRNENGTVAFWEIHDNGRFREPADDIVDAFQKMDRESLQDFKDDRDRKARKKQREAERKQEEASWNFAEECNFAFRTQIPITEGWKK